MLSPTAVSAVVDAITSAAVAVLLVGAAVTLVIASVFAFDAIKRALGYGGGSVLPPVQPAAQSTTVSYTQKATPEEWADFYRGDDGFVAAEMDAIADREAFFADMSRGHERDEDMVMYDGEWMTYAAAERQQEKDIYYEQLMQEERPNG